MKTYGWISAETNDTENTSIAQLPFEFLTASDANIGKMLAINNAGARSPNVRNVLPFTSSLLRNIGFSMDINVHDVLEYSRKTTGT